MSVFKNLYHQILQTLLGQNMSDSFAILPEIEQDESFYTVSKDFFPYGIPVHYIQADETLLEELTGLDYFSKPALLFFPPIGSVKNWRGETKQSFSGYQSIEAVLLSKVVRQMGVGSQVIAVMPETFLTSQSGRIAREQIFAIAHPVMIINHTFPWDELGIPVYRAFQINTVVLAKNENSSEPIKFFEIPQLKDEDHARAIFSDFQKLNKQGGGQTEYGYVIREREKIGDKWHYDYHHPVTTKKKQDLAIFGTTRILSDLFEIRRGQIHIANDRNLLISKKINSGDQHGIQLVEGRDLHADGSLTIGTRFYTENPPPTAFLRQGDILIRTIHSFSTQYKSAYPVVEVPADILPSVAAQSVLILRPIVLLSEPERAFILAYLRSNTFFDFLQIETTGVNITHFVVEKIPVPVPDENMLIAINSINQAIVQFQNWIDDAESAKNSIFKTQSSNDARLETLSAGRRARQRIDAGLLIDDYHHRIRTQFPHPLAYLWRSVEASYENSDGYTQVLDTAEIALCYVASMAMVAINNMQDEKIKWLESIAVNVVDKGHGTSMGDWISILRETAASKAFRNRVDALPFYEATRILADNELNTAVQRLKKQRDDKSHGRGPKVRISIEKAYRSARSDLEILYRAIDFLTEYPLRYIESTRRDSISKQTTYSYRELRGDHPFVPVLEDVCSDPELEAGSLYLVNRQKNLYLLRPLLIRRECPECGAWATFYLDQYDRTTNSPILKSMEHGHTVLEPNLLSAFKQMGLLK